MKHKTLDLAAEIRRASLPGHLAGFLFPVFEATSNSLHSIEDKYGEQAHELGFIKVEFNIDTNSIAVEDNGEGFSKDNLDAFLTPFTGRKLKRNGKGFGRFISFKIFSRVFYTLPTDFEDGNRRNAAFEYLPLSTGENLDEIDDISLIEPHKRDTGLTVVFREPKEDFYKFFDFSNESFEEGYTEETILIAFLDHFLLEFIQKKTPRNFLFVIGGVKFNLSEYFSESVEFQGEKVVFLELEDESEEFTLRFMQIDAKKLKRHSLYFYADNRATSDLENISKGLKDTAFEGDKRNYNYLVAVTSPFFKASQSRDKIENLGIKIQHNNKEKTLKDALAAEAKDHILDLEPAYTGRRRETIKLQVEELIALDPMLRRGLGEQSLDEFVNNRGITESREQLAQDLFITRTRLRGKFDFRKINSQTSFEQLKNVVRNRISADAKEALAVYVAYRNDVIRVLSEMLNRKDDGSIAKEDAVHELIYPRYKDSEEIDYSSHNLWLIDDDLAYAEYISSDRTLISPT
ncbi:ATP-binding protein [Roseibium album]|uniref:ATP-binding protein n=1 Tax=Roseibium album TaxID=311410 RepID=UPI00391AB99D